MFLGFLNSFYKLALCQMRKTFKTSDKVNAPIAGFIAATSLLVDSPARGRDLAMLIFVRSLYFFVIFYIKTVKDITIPHFSMVLSLMVGGQFGYLLGKDAELLPKDVHKNLDKICN